jgi:hypothetical protein
VDTFKLDEKSPLRAAPDGNNTPLSAQIPRQAGPATKLQNLRGVFSLFIPQRELIVRNIAFNIEST